MKTRLQQSLIISMFFILPMVGLSQEKIEKPAKTFQLSIFPFLGTDGIHTLNSRYEISINLFAGITGGVDGLEVGGFANINQGSMEGLQAAGFGNIVKGDVDGFQAAGFMNVVNGTSSGINMAGFMNAFKDEHEGIMAAGFMNVVNGNATSVAGAGFMNVVRKDFQGLVGAGFMNVAGGSAEGIYGAGFMNVARKESRGIFGAGFANVSAGIVQGIQAAGFMNLASDLQGVQMAGFLNVAGRVEGIQLGVINISDTISGVPVGFLSIARKGGLRHFEISASDGLFMNASFKIGVPAFYNIFSLGFRPDEQTHIFAPGYGIGTQINLGYPHFLNIEAHSSQLQKDWENWEPNYNYLNELRTTYSRNINSRFQLFAGITLYNHTYKPEGVNQDENKEIASWVLHENYYQDWTSQWWIGGRAGLNFIIR